MPHPLIPAGRPLPAAATRTGPGDAPAGSGRGPGDDRPPPLVQRTPGSPPGGRRWGRCCRAPRPDATTHRPRSGPVVVPHELDPVAGRDRVDLAAGVLRQPTPVEHHVPVHGL